jgi:hypothetical protein
MWNDPPTRKIIESMGIGPRDQTANKKAKRLRVVEKVLANGWLSSKDREDYRILVELWNDKKDKSAREIIEKAGICPKNGPENHKRVALKIINTGRWIHWKEVRDYKVQSILRKDPHWQLKFQEAGLT